LPKVKAGIEAWVCQLKSPRSSWLKLRLGFQDGRRGYGKEGEGRCGRIFKESCRKAELEVNGGKGA